MKFILGKKLDMSQMFDEKGNIIPVTLISAGPCFVTQKKNIEKDKYEALQVGFEKKKENKITKSQKAAPYKNVQEFKGGIEMDKFNIGDEIKASIFKEGDKVKVAAVNKGKGFTGIIKRWNFGGKPHTHGMKHEERAMGSAGPGYPQRVIKGRKMAGRLGFERVTVKNLIVVKVDEEKNLLVLKGAVPGRKGALLEIVG